MSVSMGLLVDPGWRMTPTILRALMTSEHMYGKYLLQRHSEIADKLFLNGMQSLT